MNKMILTIGELIEKIKDFDPQTEIYFYDSYAGVGGLNVEDIEYDKDEGITIVLS